MSSNVVHTSFRAERPGRDEMVEGNNLEDPKANTEEEEKDVEYPPTAQAALVMLALILGIFLTALVSPVDPWICL